MSTRGAVGAERPRQWATFRLASAPRILRLMDPEMSIDRDLVTTFVAAYGPVIDAALHDRLISPPEGWSAVVDEGAAWLQRALTELLDLPLDEQRRSPLEVFQEAMRFPTDALHSAGVEPAPRDEVAARALPGDLYGLAPASSRDLGEDAWRAHLAWGVQKAQAVGGARPRNEGHTEAVRRPAVALVGTDLMDRSRIEPVVAAGGLALEVWRNPAAIEAGLGSVLPVLVLVDLTHPAADDAIRAAAAAGVRTIAFGPHVDDIALVRARSLGADDAVARSRFFKRLQELLPKQA